MVPKITPISVTIKTLRVDDKKITSGLFQQFETGCLLTDIGIHEYIEDKTDPFTIIGRHTYKVPEEELEKCPFIYSIKGEIRISTVAQLKMTITSTLNTLKDQLFHLDRNLADAISALSRNSLAGINLLARHQLLDGPREDYPPFYEWNPSYVDEQPIPVPFNEIQQKILKNYQEAFTATDVMPWSVHMGDTQDSKKEQLCKAEASMKDSGAIDQVHKWFELNERLILAELEEDESRYENFVGKLEGLIEQVYQSPKLYIGV